MGESALVRKFIGAKAHYAEFAAMNFRSNEFRSNDTTLGLKRKYFFLWVSDERDSMDCVDCTEPN